jgi:hypothetical protein
MGWQEVLAEGMRERAVRQSGFAQGRDGWMGARLSRNDSVGRALIAPQILSQDEE